jgi:Ca2+-binding RTX toxin-like protein
MEGGTGQDALVVDHLHDFALEDPFGPDGGGIDTLQVNQGYATSLAEAMPQLSPQGLATFVLGDTVGVSLPGGTNPFVQQVDPDIENVRLMGTAAHNILGDARDNRLVGNAGDNRLYGGAGDDWLDGGAGDDWLVDGAGEDMMYGSEGDDTFVLGLDDSAVDTIVDHSGANTVRLSGAEAGRFAAVLDGDDLRLAYDGDEIAVIRDYLGHEGNFRGIDFGDGPQSFADFVHPGDMLAEFLARPGGDEADILQAAEGGEWLDGRAGNDTLLGSAGDDTMEGGNGSDVLRGGAGDDRYLVRAGDSGIDRIEDAQGRNTAELVDAEGQKLKAFLVGQDLWVTADDRPFLVVENHAAHPDAFAGVKAGDRLVDPHDLTS